MTPRVLYVNPLSLDANPAIDAIAYGLQHTLHAAAIELRVLFADFTAPHYRRQYEAAIEAGVSAKVDAIAIYVIDPSAFGDPVARARAAGIPRSEERRVGREWRCGRAPDVVQEK